MTGDKGLVGTSLKKRLGKEGHEPVLLVDKRDGKNILNMNDFELSESADVMVHLAAFNKISRTIENPELSFENNVTGTYRVLEFCRKNKIPKIIYTSSSRIIEKEKNPYTASKIYGEELVKGYSQCYRIDYVIVRPSTVYGPNDINTPRLIPIFIENALQGKELKITREEDSTLDFCYIDDFVDAMLLAMEERNKEYEISMGRGVSVSYVADLIINLAGKGSRRFYPVEIAQPQKVELDISEIKKLGYEPKVGIEEGVKRTFNWYKENLEEILKNRKDL